MNRVNIPLVNWDGDGNWEIRLGDESGVIMVVVTQYDLRVRRYGEFDDVIPWSELIDLLADINRPVELPEHLRTFDFAHQNAARAHRRALVDLLRESAGVRVG